MADQKGVFDMFKNLLSAAVLFPVTAFAAVPEALVDLPLNEGDLKAVQDVSPSKAAVRIENPEFISWEEGPQGKALAFANSDGPVKRGRVLVKIPARLDIAKGISFVCSFKTANKFARKRIYPLFRYSDAHQKSNGIFIFCFYHKIYVRTGVDGKQSDLVTNTAKTPLKADTWYRLAITYDGKTLSVWLDGKLAAAKEVQLQKPKKISFAMLGSTGDKYGYGFDGILSQVKIFDRALTPDEVTALQTEE